MRALRTAPALVLTLIFASGCAIFRPEPPEGPDLGRRGRPEPTWQNSEFDETSPELARLRETYGRKLYSKHDEELIIRDFFQEQRGGFFLDVGAFDYRKNSNTYYLEKHLGWRGIAIDALDEHRPGYEQNRPATRFFAFYVSDVSDEDVEFYVVERRKQLSTGVGYVAEAQRASRAIQVPSITLDDLLDSEGVTRIDFLNMDIEMNEPAALRGFDIERFAPRLVCIEAHSPILDFLREYMARHGYVELRHYSLADPLNMYFAPAGSDGLGDIR